MSGQVILYFDDQVDALRFVLAAGSVMAGDGSRAPDDLLQETARVTRIRLDEASLVDPKLVDPKLGDPKLGDPKNEKSKHPSPPERAA
jgi:hypothetical protein